LRFFLCQLRLCLLSLIFLTGCSMYGLKNHTTTVGMFTPHVLFPVKYQGQIKELSERIYLAKEVNGKVLIDRPLTIADRKIISWSNDFEVLFDREGLVTQCDILDGEGRILQMYRNQIKSGKVVRFDIIEKDTLRKYLNFFYDNKGFIDKIESYSYPDNSFLGTEDFTTDENSNITYIQFFDVSGQLEMKFYMDIDDVGRRTAYKQFDKKGNKLAEANVIYNNNGCIKTKTEVDETGKLNSSNYEYRYDEKGNWIQCIVNTNNHKLLIIRRYEYWGMK